MKSVLVADLGGTKARFARLTRDLDVLDSRRAPTTRDLGSFLGTMSDALREIAAQDHGGVEAPCALGVGTAGLITPDRRVIHAAPNLPFVDPFPLADYFEREVGLPTTLIFTPVLGVTSLLVTDLLAFSVTVGGSPAPGRIGLDGLDQLFIGGTLVVPITATSGFYMGEIEVTVLFQ